MLTSVHRHLLSRFHCDKSRSKERRSKGGAITALEVNSLFIFLFMWKVFCFMATVCRQNWRIVGKSSAMYSYQAAAEQPWHWAKTQGARQSAGKQQQKGSAMKRRTEVIMLLLLLREFKYLTSWWQTLCDLLCVCVLCPQGGLGNTCPGLQLLRKTERHSGRHCTGGTLIPDYGDDKCRKCKGLQRTLKWTAVNRVIEWLTKLMLLLAALKLAPIQHLTCGFAHGSTFQHLTAKRLLSTLV